MKGKIKMQKGHSLRSLRLIGYSLVSKFLSIIIFNKLFASQKIENSLKKANLS